MEKIYHKMVLPSMTDEVSMTAQIAQVGPKGGGTYVSNPSANPAGAGRITVEFTPSGGEISSAFCGSYILHLVKFFTNISGAFCMFCGISTCFRAEFQV